MKSAQSKSFGRLVLYALTFLGVYLSYQVLSPFIVTLAWAAIFAILFHGMHAALSPRIGGSRAALVTTLLVAVAIVAPAVMPRVSAGARGAAGLRLPAAGLAKRASVRSRSCGKRPGSRSPVAVTGRSDTAPD